MTSPHPLGPYPVKLTERLESWATRGAGAHVSRRARRRGRAGGASRYREALAPSPKHRAGDSRPRALARASDPHSVGQQHRARAAGAGRDVHRRALRAHRAGLFAAGEGLQHAAPDLRAGAARARVRGRGRRRSSARSGRHAAGCRARGLGVAAASPPVHGVRRPRGHGGDARRGRGARESRWRHDCQGAVHVGLDRPAEGRHQHAADALLEPGDDSVDVFLFLRRRASGAVRLAALEPHGGWQPQLRHRALQRRHALHRRREADARALRRHGSQPAGRAVHRAFHRAALLRDAACRTCAATRCCARRSFAS